MNRFDISYDAEILLLSRKINSFVGIDIMYYDIDGMALAKYLVDYGFRFIGVLDRKDLKQFKKLYKKCFWGKK